MNEVIYDVKPILTIGIIQLPSDITLDNEVPFILSQIKGVCWRMQKLNFENNDDIIISKTYENAMKNIKKAASTFIPTDNTRYGGIDIIALACTSMSFTLGPEKVQEELLKGYPNALISTDMATATINALQCFKNNTMQCNIGLLTPYVNELHIKYINFLTNYDFNIVFDYNLSLSTDTKVTSLNPESILDYAKFIIKQNNNITVMLIGCSAFRSTGYNFIDHAEEILGIPVITSNQALIWQCLHKCSNIAKDDIKNIKGYGCLFRDHIL